jgi:two-component system sporulation sensor kinase B
MPAEDCTRLRDQLDQLKSPDTVSAVHSIVDDQGLPVWVAHSLRKVQTDCDLTVVGCMTPIASEFIATKLNVSIISQFVHKIGNHFQLINLLMGSLKRVGTNVEEVEALQQTIDRAVEFTRSFSQFSQPPVCVMAVDLGDILNSATRLAASACFEKNVGFQNVGDSQTLNGVLVRGDAFLLELAFGAVFQNALEATNIGDQISVDAKSERERTAGRGIARIVVADTGAGIDRDMVAKVAEPFVTSKRDRDGLGLSTAVRIIEMHGGTLKITSTPGQETRVEIVLPIAHGSEQGWK